MHRHPMQRAKASLIWSALGLAALGPVIVAAQSPLLAWRDPIYIAAGFAGIAGLALMLWQPVLAAGYLPGLSPGRARRTHRWIGGALVACVGLHVLGLWMTSPPDVIDALLLRSPTPFSAWGVVAMWALFATALIAGFRRRLSLSPRIWRRLHTGLAALIVSGTIVHVLLIEGTMGTVSKFALCALVLLVTCKVFADLRVWSHRRDHGG